MSDADREELHRKAVTGDKDAQKRLGMSRCRSNECCGHAGSPTSYPTGCATCPFLGWDQGNECEACNLNDKVQIPVDVDAEVINAIPANCPLWNGAQLVDLKQMAAHR